jgi:hypothetical protein
VNNAPSFIDNGCPHNLADEVEEIMGYTEDKLWDRINDGWSRMSRDQRLLWEAIKIRPAEWELRGHGPCWVVAVIGQNVLYFNHHEDGFNRSEWKTLGVLQDYQSMQWELDEAIQNELNIMQTGYNPGPRTTGPLPGVFEN